MSNIELPIGGGVVWPHPLPIYNGPSFAGLSFLLVSASGKPNHTLKILTQVPSLFNLAYITGTWQGDGAAKDFTGHVIDVQGAISITCVWANGMGGANTLTGSLTFLPVHVAGKVLELPAWFLQGSVTVTNANGMTVPGGPGNVSGYASIVLVVEP